mmetsp:Transcript_27415/g.20569  ORF Transcript_27415/g.20569 Transcript_27415/m.20569 type:complete len:108 (+) Transcript_27415:220-543(+)
MQQGKVEDQMGSGNVPMDPKDCQSFSSLNRLWRQNNPVVVTSPSYIAQGYQSPGILGANPESGGNEKMEIYQSFTSLLNASRNLSEKGKLGQNQSAFRKGSSGKNEN